MSTKKGYTLNHELLFKPVETKADQKLLATIAHDIWHEYWPALIGKEQTDYMVKKFQSLEAIIRDMEENAYEYWLITDPQNEPGDDECSSIVGYTGGHVEPETNRFFISKIYLYEHNRGRGFASATIRFYEQLCHARGLSALYLTVNKHNELGIRAYKGKGFETIDSVETDIGSGFIMDDYIMEKRV